jgi:hypothetical protein
MAVLSDLHFPLLHVYFHASKFMVLENLSFDPKISTHRRKVILKYILENSVWSTDFNELRMGRRKWCCCGKT